MLIKLYDIHAPNECHIATTSNHPNVISVEGQNKCTQWFILMAPVMIFFKSKQFDHPQARLQGFLIKPRNYIGGLNIFIGWQNKWVRWSGKFLKLQHILTDYYMSDIIAYVQLFTWRDVQNWNILLCWYTENWELSWCQLWELRVIMMPALRIESYHDASFENWELSWCQLWELRVIMMPALRIESYHDASFENWELSWCQLCHRWQNCILINTSSILSLLTYTTLHAAISNHHVDLHSLWLSGAI